MRKNDDDDDGRCEGETGTEIEGRYKEEDDG